jgi:paraquat-inducible protein B
MSKGASKTMIGGFVVGAVALLLVTVLIFGSGRFFSQKLKAVLFFEESVSGLSVGAPVVFRGVNVGSVTAVELWNYPQEMKMLIPVYIEIDPARFKFIGADKYKDPSLKRQIEKGLRCQIKMQSLVTGQLMIYADYFPGTPARLVKAEPNYPEIPTILSGTEAAMKALEKIPVQELLAKVTSSLTGIERLINAPETQEVARTLNTTLNETKQALKDVRSLVQRVDARIEPLSSEIKGTLTDTRKLVNTADKEIMPLAAGLNKTLNEAGGVLGEARKTLNQASEVISGDSILSAEVISTLEELKRTLRSLQNLSDYLKQHPDALIRGKSPSGGK